VGACAALEYLACNGLICGSPPAGHGTVSTAHGRMPVPVPAVLELARRCSIPLAASGDLPPGELLTPTGLALMALHAQHFSAGLGYCPGAVGMGLGHRVLDRPNLVRLVLHTPAVTAEEGPRWESLVVQEAWIDDATPEEIAVLMNRLRDAGAIDVAVHVGTLFAVILYFWRDVKLALSGLPRALVGKVDTEGAKLAFLLIISSIPVVAFGLLLKLTGLDQSMRSIAVVGWTMLIFGIVLYWADQAGGTERKVKDWSMRDAMVMGVWQAIALIPGTSRSGITITGARFMGYARPDAARLAMLMSIPVILESGALLAGEAAYSSNIGVMRDSAIAAAFAFVSALLALVLMMRLLRSVSFTPYVIYRVALGLILLIIAYS